MSELSLLGFEMLAAEIADDTGVDDETAWELAWELMPDLQSDIFSDVRYRPRKVVLLLTARELMDLTER